MLTTPYKIYLEEDTPLEPEDPDDVPGKEDGHYPDDEPIPPATTTESN